LQEVSFARDFVHGSTHVAEHELTAHSRTPGLNGS
jgi:hypothetical protein